MRRLALACMLTAALGGQALAQDASHVISDMVGDLQRLQVQMARGDRAAYAKQQERLHAIGAAILAAKPEIWQQKSETDAAAAYVLGGGQPRDLSRLLERGVVPKSEEDLLRGALAYASGREQDAENLLGGIDARQVSLKLAGQLAYAQSVLVTSRAPKRAIELLDVARLLAPGSLVEEAALRREILLAGDERDSDRVVFLARQYVERFGRSIYAENFILGLAATGVRYRFLDDLTNLQKFESLLSLATTEQRRGFLLTLARALTIAGKFDVAAVAAQDALKESSPGGSEEARGHMYLAISHVMLDRYDAGVAELHQADAGKLDRADRELLTAALFVAQHLRDTYSDSTLDHAAREDRVARARSPSMGLDVSADPVGVTIARAEGAVARGEVLNQAPKIPK